MKKRKIGLFALAIGIIIAIPKIASASISNWLLWGGVVTTVVAVGATFTPAAPVAPVLGVVEVVGIVGGVATHPVVTPLWAPPELQPVFEVQLWPFNLFALATIDQMILADEVLAMDLQPVAIPAGPEFAQYTSIYANANAVIADYNILRQDIVDQDPTLAYLSLMEVSNGLDQLADSIQASGVDTGLSQQDMENASVSISSNGLPQFELDHLTNSGFSPEFIAAFTDLHFQDAPDGSGLTAITPSQAIRNVADEFANKAMDLGVFIDNPPGGSSGGPGLGSF
jgi:hypothetical protein